MYILISCIDLLESIQEIRSHLHYIGKYFEKVREGAKEEIVP